jgi:hypothetical protein
MPVRSGQERVRMYAGFIRAVIVAGLPIRAGGAKMPLHPPSANNSKE